MPITGDDRRPAGKDPVTVLSGLAQTGPLPAPRPANERERLEVLRRYGILDTPPEPAFDDIARSHICATPVSSISLIDADRQWFKAKVGFDACETSRDSGFCAHRIGARWRSTTSSCAV